MRALRYTGLGQAEVAEVPDPRPAETEVLVQVEAAGICHTDLDILHGNYAATFPVTPGHEFAGTVIGTGQEVDRAWLGRRVAVDPLRSCGACRPCLHGRTNLCEHLRAYGAEIDGGLATHAAVEVSQLVDVGDLAADLAAMAEPLACAVNAARRSAITASDDVLVVGAGPIGLLILTAFGSRGASLSAAEPQDRRRDHAAGFGAAASYPSINAALQARAVRASTSSSTSPACRRSRKPGWVRYGVAGASCFSAFVRRNQQSPSTHTACTPTRSPSWARSPSTALWPMPLNCFERRGSQCANSSRTGSGSRSYQPPCPSSERRTR